MALQTSYTRFLSFVKDHLSQKEYLIVQENKSHFLDITQLSYAHAFTHKYIDVPRYTNTNLYIPIMRYYATKMEGSIDIVFMNQHIQLCAIAFYFYYEEFLELDF